MPNLLNKTSLIFALIAGCYLLSGCYKAKEGCLDLWAKNYSVSSDNACEDCCTYPNIVLQMDHLWNDETFNFGDTLTNDLNTNVVLVDQKLYLSQWKYHVTDDSEINKLDSLQLTKGESLIQIDKDILLIIQNQATATNHTYKGEGKLTAVDFVYGINDQLDGLSLLEAEAYEVLQYDNFMRENQKYQTAWFKLAIGTTYIDTISFFLDKDIPLTTTSESIIDLGQNLSIKIQLDYDELFSGINFEVSDQATIKQKMSLNQTNWIK